LVLNVCFWSFFEAITKLNSNPVVSHYEGKEEFSCITNAAIKLSLDRINDNTCDCPDGSDEPGTAACANIDPLSPEQPLAGSLSGSTNTTNALPGFWCANKGHIGMYVPFLYVNDGVCDYELCCDGSEEYAGVGGVKCENKCAEIGKEYRRLEDEKKKAMQNAAKKRGAMVNEAKNLRQKVENKVADLKKEIAALEAKKEELAQKHREAEQQDKGKVVRGGGDNGGGKIGVLTGLAKTRINELRDTLDNVVNQRDALKERVGELEELLTKFKTEYNPNFNDEGVKAAIRSFEDYSARQAANVEEVLPDEDILSVLKEDSESNGINWSEFEEGEGSDTDIRKSTNTLTLKRCSANTSIQSTTLRPTSLLPSALFSTAPSTHSAYGPSPMASSPTTPPPARSLLLSAPPAKPSTLPTAISPTSRHPSPLSNPTSTQTTAQTTSSAPSRASAFPSRRENTPTSNAGWTAPSKSPKRVTGRATWATLSASIARWPTKRSESTARVSERARGWFCATRTVNSAGTDPRGEPMSGLAALRLKSFGA
jgi:hypothetical protein